MSLNEYIFSLTNIEVAYLKNFSTSSSERIAVIQKVEEHRKKYFNQRPFRYQDYDLHRKFVSRFKLSGEKIMVDYAWNNISDKLKDITINFLNNDTSDTADTIELFNNDRKLCEARKRFCMQNALSVKIILKLMKSVLQRKDELGHFKSLLELEDFYSSYLDQDEKAVNVLCKIRYKYRNKRYEQMEEDVKELQSFYNSKKISILTKINFAGLLSTHYVNEQMTIDQNVLLDDLFNEIALNPYYNKTLIENINKYFFNDCIYTNNISKALGYYFDILRNPSKSNTESNVYHIGTAITLYDLDTAADLLPPHVQTNMNQMNIFMLPLLGRYYYLTGQYDRALPYLQSVNKKNVKLKSDVLFVNSYNAYFGVLYNQKNYNEVIKLYENPNFKIRYYEARKHRILNTFEIRLFYILSCLMKKKFNLLSSNSKIVSLMKNDVDNADLFIKLNAKKNLEKLAEEDLIITSQLSEKYDQLKNEVKDFEQNIVKYSGN